MLNLYIDVPQYVQILQALPPSERKCCHEFAKQGYTTLIVGSVTFILANDEPKKAEWK